MTLSLRTLVFFVYMFSLTGLSYQEAGQNKPSTQNMALSHHVRSNNLVNVAKCTVLFIRNVMQYILIRWC